MLTSAGKLPFKGIIHVAGINMLWRASERSIRDSVRNVMAVAADNGFQSIAFPLIGAGSGSFNQERAKEIMLDELARLAGMVESTASAFFRKEFGGHTKYKIYCKHGTNLVTAIKMLNDELTPSILFNQLPDEHADAESDDDDDE